MEHRITMNMHSDYKTDNKTNSYSGLVAAIDVGTAKVSCLIAEVVNSGQIQVRGVGNRACRGVQAGAVVDMDLTEQSIRASVDQAEKMAGTRISDVFVSVSAGDPMSEVIEVDLDVDGHAIDTDDVETLIQKALEVVVVEEGRVILHAFPAAYAVDGHFGAKAPIGMFGKSLNLAMLVVTVSEGPLKNLESVVRRSHLNVSGFVLSGYASGLACLVDDEMQMGAACIDLGAGITSISVFAQGAMVHGEVLPIGGSYITHEVARALLTPFDQAERLKTFSGAAIFDSADLRMEIEVPQIGEGDNDSLIRMPRSQLTSLMQKELEKVFTNVSQRLDTSGFSGVAGKRVVITGGVAQAVGIRDLASNVMGRIVRVGQPQMLGGLPQAVQNPSFSVALGLLKYATERAANDYGLGRKEAIVSKAATGMFGKLKNWAKANF